ncbi:acyl transferase/acyl hydrolase/lysophospholipase [Pyrenochaeta sp. MPI-SDFR-AT-0127]|nr:acyl transferase/acyl hydrolase/lysophospholipase [Pyrenochaeta sp. MPI-SDFR-AT-0127]
MAQSLPLQHGSEPHPLETSGLCLLSLDGGGVRGLSTLYLLKALMVQLNRSRSVVGLSPVKPCEVFDLIGGTGTGGLIAIMLGRLEMDVDECITAHCRLMDSIFKTRSNSLRISRAGRAKAQFGSNALESAIEELLNNKGISPTDAFNNDKNHGCRTSYALPGEHGISATICEAARATCAVDSFFSPVSIEIRNFVDGPLSANNPVAEVEGEAANIWTPQTGDLRPLVKCFVSIGTGLPGTMATEDRVITQTLFAIATETEAEHRRFLSRWVRHSDQERYFHFNVEQGFQGVGLAEYKEQGKIEAATCQYLAHQAQTSRAQACVRNLQQKRSKFIVDFACTRR